MKFTLIEKTDVDLEIETDDKELPNLVRAKLIEKGVDAYIYSPHVLLGVERLHIHSQNPLKDLETSLKEIKKDIEEWKNEMNKKMSKK